MFINAWHHKKIRQNACMMTYSENKSTFYKMIKLCSVLLMTVMATGPAAEDLLMSWEQEPWQFL